MLHPEPEDRNRLEIDDLPHIVWLSTADGATLYVNRFGRELLGLDADERGAEAWLRRVHPTDEARVREAWRRPEGEGRAHEIEYRLRAADGEYRWVLERGRLRHNSEGLVFPWVGTCTVIDEHRHAERALERAQAAQRASDERLCRFFDLGLIGMAIASPARNFVEVNDQLCEILGYERRELLQKPWTELTHPDDIEADESRFERVLAGGSDGYTAEKRFIRKDGRIVHAALALNCLRRTDGSPDSFLALVQDVSEHRRSDEQQARLSQAVDQTTESIVITDAQGTILYVNPAFESVTGYGRAEVLGQNPRLLKSGYQDAAFYRRMWETIAGGGVWKGRLVNRRKDGTLLEEDATIGPVRDASGRIVNYVAVKRDVTHETRLERQLLQTQRLEAVGRLAGGVAHDFNNLLGVIMGYAEITRRKLPSADPLREKLDEILKAAERATSLTRQLLAFSRQQVLQPRVLDLNAVISDMEKMLRRLIGEDIALTTALEPGAGNIKADPGQIEQVIMNLAVNARDAMPQGGRLAIETHAAEFDADFVASHPLAKPGRYVLLAVSDTGAGMDAETQAHAFEPFFTTKERGKGTGLGLATVYGIVKQSEGYVWLYSEVGIGTTFKIYLPRVDAAAAAMRRHETAPLARGMETVLLVEDEGSLRDLLCEALQEAGYTLLVARDGDQAARIAEEYGGVIHLIITDVIMPGLTGRALVERLIPTRPEARVLYMSGYAHAAIESHGVLSPGAEFLGKPFTPDQLLRKVRHLLDARAATGARP